MSLQYIRTGKKRIFDLGVRFDPPQSTLTLKRESQSKGQKSKLSQTYRVTYQNLCEKGTKPVGKVQLNQTY